MSGPGAPLPLTPTLTGLKAVVAVAAVVPLLMVAGVSTATSRPFGVPAPWWPVAAALVFVAITMASMQASAVVRPLDAGATPKQARAATTAALRLATGIRCAQALGPVLVAVALMFSMKVGGTWVFLVALVAAGVLLAWYAWPSRRTLRRLRVQLERAGRRACFG